jgi:type I restriction enzyme S subunit
MATSQDIVTWTCGPRVRPRYLLLCLRAMRRDLLERLAMGSTHKTIYMPDVESIQIPLPPIEEQDSIVDEVWRRLNAIGGAMDRLSEQVELLREHRQALITAAVTGKLEVA